MGGSKRRAALLALVLCSWPAAAIAAPKILVLAETSGESKVAAALVSAATEAGHRVTTADATLADSALMLGCEPTSDECLDQVAQTAGAAGVLVASPVEGDDGNVFLRLRRVGRATLSRQMSRTADKSTLERAIEGLFGSGAAPAEAAGSGSDTGSAPAGAAGSGSDTGSGSGAAPAGAAGSGSDTGSGSDSSVGAGADLSATADTGGGGFSLGRVKTRSWIVVGAGAAVTGVGVGLLIASRSKQSRVDDAPVDTLEDLQDLKDLEDSGRTLTRWGNVATVLGGVTLAAGAVLVVIDARRSPGADSGLSLAPVPGGGAITFSGVLP